MLADSGGMAGPTLPAPHTHTAKDAPVQRRWSETSVSTPPLVQLDEKNLLYIILYTVVCSRSVARRC